MEFQDIPDYIQLLHIDDMGEWVSVGYKFNGKPKMLDIFKSDDDAHWATFEGKITPWRAFLVAINEEQSEWNKREAKSTINNLHPVFQDIFKPFTTPKNI